MLPRVLLIVPVLLASGAMVLSACGDDDDERPSNGDDVTATVTETSDSTAPARENDDSAEPTLTASPGSYTPLLEDIGEGFFVDLRETRALTSEDYRNEAMFGGEDGGPLLAEWGYEGGYRMLLEPENRSTDVLTGLYYASIESHLFADADGAQAFLDRFDEQLASAPINTAVEDVPALGNDWAAWTALDANPVPDSDIPAAFHTYLFRRGNMVGIVRTWGAAPFMTITTAYGIAVTMDEKALGEKPAIEPTPIGADTPPAEGSATE